MADTEVGASAGTFKKLILFSGNDYLGLSSHPTIIKAATQASNYASSTLHILMIFG